MLSTSTRSFGFSECTCLMSSMPLRPGIDMSSSSTSKSSARTRSSTSCPFCASPTTARSAAAESSCFSPSRTIVWSSARTMRIMAFPP
jgi:hypothetical protein